MRFVRCGNNKSNVNMGYKTQGIKTVVFAVNT